MGDAHLAGRGRLLRRRAGRCDIIAFPIASSLGFVNRAAVFIVTREGQEGERHLRTLGMEIVGQRLCQGFSWAQAQAEARDLVTAVEGAVKV